MTRPKTGQGMSVELRKQLEENVVPANKKETVDELPRWVKTALIYRAIDGLTNEEAASRFRKAGKTLSMYARSPAARLWLSTLQDFLDDPVAMAKAILAANAHSITLERFAFLEAAIAAGDYKEGDKIARDIQDRIGIVAQRAKQDTPMTIRIELGGGDLSAAIIDTDYEVMDDTGDA